MIYDIPTKRAGDFQLPVLGLGTWQMGGRLSRNKNNDDQRDIQGIRNAVRAGITHIDTAEIYAQGHSEELVAEALSLFERKEIFLTSKVSSYNLKYDQIIASAKASLERLKTDQFDLYLIHGPSDEVPLAESMKAMDFLLENGLTKNIGVSNFDIPLLEEAQACTKHKIVNNQLHYSLEAREYERNGTLEYCRENQILITAYRPTGKGRLAKKGLALVDGMAKKYKKTPVQIAMNWVMNKDNVVVLFKTSDPDHLKENMGAFGWRLDREDEALLDTDFVAGETILVPYRDK